MVGVTFSGIEVNVCVRNYLFSFLKLTRPANCFFPSVSRTARDGVVMTHIFRVMSVSAATDSSGNFANLLLDSYFRLCPSVRPNPRCGTAEVHASFQAGRCRGHEPDRAAVAAGRNRVNVITVPLQALRQRLGPKMNRPRRSAASCRSLRKHGSMRNRPACSTAVVEHAQQSGLFP